MKLNVLLLPGDGIGVEVTREAEKVLRHIADNYHHELVLNQALLGGIAIHQTGNPFPDATRRLALEADATLMGAVGLPEFDNAPPEKRPERGLLGIRQTLQVYANLRPVRSYKALIDSSPLKNELVDGTDMIIVRELTGGIYYGTPRGISGSGAEERAVNTMTYTRAEIGGCRTWRFNSRASAARKSLASISRMCSKTRNSGARWLSKCRNNIPMSHWNTFWWITAQCNWFSIRAGSMWCSRKICSAISLSDEGAVLAGSIGMLPSASIGNQRPSGAWTGLYEPVHGSAPDIAGQNKANPLGAIGSVAALLEYSFGLTEEAAAVNRAMEGAK